MKEVNPSIIHLDQRSEAWLEFRRSRIGASEATIICGLSPWKSSMELWMDKRDPSPKERVTNFAIERGVRLEPVVLGMCSILLDKSFEPVTMAHPDENWIMASLDGWDEESSTLLEIKVGNEKDHKARVVPQKYYPQLQHQIYVTVAKRAYYASYWVKKGTDEMRGDLNIIEVQRDDEFLSRYLPEAKRFYDCMQSGVPPVSVRII